MKGTPKDRICIEGLRLLGIHGVHEKEREAKQEFIVDISAVFDTRKAAASDDLKDTLDYGYFRAVAGRIVEGPPCNLIERLAHMIAKEILKDQRIHEVSVTVRKPRADGVIAGVAITRT